MLTVIEIRPLRGSVPDTNFQAHEERDTVGKPLFISLRSWRNNYLQHSGAEKPGFPDTINGGRIRAPHAVKNYRFDAVLIETS